MPSGQLNRAGGNFRCPVFLAGGFAWFLRDAICGLVCKRGAFGLDRRRASVPGPVSLLDFAGGRA